MKKKIIKGDCPEIVIKPKVMEIKDIIDELPRWGNFRRRKLEAIDTIIIHHSASPTGLYGPKQFAEWHRQNMGAPAICYHYHIAGDGTISQCNVLEDIVWHAGNANYSSIGIELDGNFEIEEPTLEQLQSLRWLVQELEDNLNKTLQLKAHKEVQATACCGKNLIAHKSEWRTLNE